jgi:hypothetical protein
VNKENIIQTNKWINLETTTIYMKRKKRKNGHQGFYLSKEHYQQRFYMELLLIIYQQWFIGRTIVDIEISTAVLPMNRC